MTREEVADSRAERLNAAQRSLFEALLAHVPRRRRDAVVEGLNRLEEAARALAG